MAELQEELSRLWPLYQRLSKMVELEKRPGGRRTPPASKPPANLTAVSQMAMLEELIVDWVESAEWVLEPWSRIPIPVPCPYCGGELTGRIQRDQYDDHGYMRGYIKCISTEPHPEGVQKKWFQPEWRRLGVLAGVYEDGRFKAS